ncbi:MAG: T9SS type A sorting domain-containing protein [Chitinophagales bacterium]
MNQKLYLNLLAIFLSASIFAQPVMQWENALNASNEDDSFCIDHTSDGGAIVCSGSYSAAGGDKTETSIGKDYWVIKFNAEGAIEWQNTLGGALDDQANVCHQTVDGGYIIGGHSNSPHSTDKSENAIGITDYWIIKLNAAGAIVWENTIGGKGQEFLSDIHEISGVGYIVAGTSTSSIGFDKTEAKHSNYPDFWIMQLDASGTIIWQNTIGGTGSEMEPRIVQTIDGGFLVGGYSDSNIGYEKTENCIGNYDYWVVKLDAAGNVEWDNTIGSTNADELNSIIVLPGGGYLLGGVGGAGISGDKTEFDGLSDYWILEINALGSIIWQRTIGGTHTDRLENMITTMDGNILLTGFSFSGISGDKTVPQWNDGDYWVIKIDVNGNILWQEDYGTIAADNIFSAMQSNDGGYWICGFTNAGISGNKSEPAYGSNDIWIVKIAPDNCVAEICNGLDDDCNGLIDDDISISISIATDDETIVCKGESVVLEATHTGTNLQWMKNGVSIAGQIFPTYNVTATGIYNCVSSTACSVATSNEINVTVNPTPKATISAGGPISFCAGGSVLLTATTNIGTNYQWLKNGFSIAGATSSTYTATTAGNYKCRITVAATGCLKESSKIVVSIVCKEGEMNSDQQILIYPNPNNGTFLISATLRPLCALCDKNGTIIEIYNSFGELIYSKQINETDGIINETIDLGNISSGIYFIKLSDGENEMVQKLIIN